MRLHFQPGLTEVQSGEHAPDLLPSSHASPTSTNMLPHKLHALSPPAPERDLHFHPGSMLHALEQPSWFTVLLSSQFSLDGIQMPSPQIVLHTLGTETGGRGQIQPNSILHDGPHPSPATKFPSSHSSAPFSVPLPHPDVHWSGLPAAWAHAHVASTVQFALQPSPPTLLLSSHCSPSSRHPLPHAE